MCMYVVHWNIFMVNKRDLQQQQQQQKYYYHNTIIHISYYVHSIFICILHILKET